ncbi:MAG TPA: MFS transporter [Candidatus Acidoferrales bacterium]|jgi:putative MFS transporter|nr:MFS transporter [Candidatus Acidoferrales bacterium]
MSASITIAKEQRQTAVLIARMERLHICSWHVKAGVAMGLATFFDAYGTLSIGYVLPVLAGLWHLTPQNIGFLISASFVGQIAGGIFFGWLAERIGRVRSATYAVGVYALTSLACALSWNFASLLALRTIQGIGLGGEVPVGATYINEISRAKGRGRFFLLYELIFPTGLTGAAVLGFWLVPRYGWRSMFIIGGVAGLLSMFVIRRLSESPRWLMSKGRFEEADRIVSEIEKEASSGGRALDPALPATTLPPPRGTASWTGIFSGIYLSRTLVVWGLAIFTYFVSYGFNTWLPTIYRTYYHLNVSTALFYGLLTNIVGLVGAFLCAMLVDHLGRRLSYIGAFALACVPLLILWRTGAHTSKEVFILSSISFLFISANSMLFYLYTPEIYPTRLRSLGTGMASCWVRIASAVGPSIVGVTLVGSGVPGVFLLFGGMSLLGAFVALGATETTNRPLEEISP